MKIQCSQKNKVNIDKIMFLALKIVIGFGESILRKSPELL